MRVQTIGDAADLAALQRHWQGLWARCPEATPFQHPSWLIPWWKAFGPGRLSTLAIWDGADLAGLCPLYVEHADEGPRLLPLGIGISDVCSLLADPEREHHVLSAIGEALSSIALPVLWTDLPDATAAGRLLPPPGWASETGPGTPCPTIPLVGARLLDDGMPDVVPASKRRKVRMAGHRAERRGGVAARSGEELGSGPFLDVLEELHAKRWQTRGETGVLQDERVRAFHRMALPRLLAEGRADLEVIAIEGRPAAAYYGLRDAGACYAYLGGIDPDFERESPGSLVLARALSRAVTRGAASFNLLRGREDYKYAWGAVDTPLHWRRLWPTQGSP